MRTTTRRAIRPGCAPWRGPGAFAREWRPSTPALQRRVRGRCGRCAGGRLGQRDGQELHKGFSDLQQGYQGLSSAYAQFARRRYQASAEARDFVFMMVQDEERHVSLAQVSKLDGRIVGQIAMKRDKEPSYQVDDIGSFVFYKPADSVIAGYGFHPSRSGVAVR